MKMLSRRWLWRSLGILALGLAATSPTRAAGNYKRTTLLTFNRAVALPGVALGPGTYAFEIADPISAWTAVSVSSADRSRVYFSAFTNTIDRPVGMPRRQAVSFVEARADAPTPIAVWWPADESTGREFIYRK